MKWFNSIITKITIIFALSLIGIIAMLFIFVTHQLHTETMNWENYAKHALHSSFDRDSKTLNFEQLNSMGLSLVKDKKLIDEILSFNQTRQPPNFGEGGGPKSFRGIRAVPHKRGIYILFTTKDGTTILDTGFRKELFPSLIFPFIAFILVLILYIAIIKSILPLYDLRKKVKRFSEGDYAIECSSKKKDEIGALANEFDFAVKKIKNLRDSRQLFLRNIMHELKTPIMKGKFIAELLENDKYKDSLHNVFNRQENLIEEFSRIEKLSADEMKLNIAEYNLEDVLDFSFDILGHEEEHIIADITPQKINVDFELFGTALKNLLDNGINYSKDGKVNIFNKDGTLFISNISEPLEFELEKYSQPYFLEGKKQKSSRGLGFGLFITWHIFRLHGTPFSYKREDGKNIFLIDLNAKNS